MNCRNEETRLSRMEYTCTYKCKKHYTPHESNGGTTQEHKISCDSTGQWRDLQKFRSFTCREGKRIEIQLESCKQNEKINFLYLLLRRMTRRLRTHTAEVHSGTCCSRKSHKYVLMALARVNIPKSRECGSEE